jgi:iron complex outermembrane recepter protein
MKANSIYIIIVLFLFSSINQAKSVSSILSGKVTDKASRESMPGVTIYIPELKRGTITDINGKFTIDDLPSGKIVVQVTFIGYKRIIEAVDLNVTSVKNFELEEAVSELHEIVVTGLSRSGEINRTPTPIVTIPKLQLLEGGGGNIIDALTAKPGVSQISTGSGISKPVIRGLGYNRVVVVNDGIRQEGQQWGDEHGVEIDEFSINSVEILKGPASLMFGSDAMAGVINFIPPTTLPKGTIEGNVISNYQTNNGLIGYSLNLGGNQNNFIWDVRWSQKLAHAYRNKYDGFVLNSGYVENSIEGLLGVNKSWGYSHLKISNYNMKPGIVEGERDSLSGNFVQPEATSDSTVENVIMNEAALKSYDSLLPYQKIKHTKVVLDQHFVLGDGSLKTIIGWQKNERLEFADVFDVDQYGLYFLLNTLNYDLKYIFPQTNNYDFAIGINGMFQQSQNKGTEFLIPEYNLFDAGAFVTAKKAIGKLDVSTGIRFDQRNQNSQNLFLNSSGLPTESGSPDAQLRFEAFNKTFNGVSGAVGVTYQLSDVFYSKINLSRGFRAPNIAELGSNGEHEGTARYEIGNSSLKAETSRQLDLTFGVNASHITGEINLFSNTINDFIYSSKLSANNGADSLIDDLPVYKFVGGNANLTGGEVTIDVHPHPLDWLHFENSFSYVRGRQLNSNNGDENLPLIPAPKLTSVLKATSRKLNKNVVNSYFKVGLDYYFIQNHAYTVNNTETNSPAYALFSAGLGTDINVKGKTIFSVYLNASNIFDVAYQSHLSRLKYAPENYATGRMGVFDMGRNFSFKIQVPIGIKSPKLQTDI